MDVTVVPSGNLQAYRFVVQRTMFSYIDVLQVCTQLLALGDAGNAVLTAVYEASALSSTVLTHLSSSSAFLHRFSP